MGDTALMHEELQALGITPNYKGYQQAVCAIQLALEEESRLRNVTKEIYWVVADAMGCARSDIERNLRTLSLRAWRVNPLRLQEIAVPGLKLYFTAILFMGYNVILSTYFTSVEKVIPAHVVSLLRGLLLIVPAAFVMAGLWGMTGVWLACPVTEGITAALGCWMDARRR